LTTGDKKLNLLTSKHPIHASYPDEIIINSGLNLKYFNTIF
jgi:hypothetical protein